MGKKRAFLVGGVLALTVASGPAQDRPPAGQAARGARDGNPRQGMARDRAQLPQGTAAISGRVLTADTARPVKRARVLVSGGGRGGRTATTDDQGRYRIAELGGGSYTVRASKTGFVDAVFGQRRPLQPGTPVVVAEAQAVTSVDLKLTRGGVITGRVVDEDGEALARALVTVQRYQYMRGERQLSPAGGDQTDDRGQYRVFGLPPGDYYVSAAAGGLGQLIGRGLQQLAVGIGALGGGGDVGGRGAGGALGGGALAALGIQDEPEATGYAPTYYPGVASAPEAGKVNVAPGQEVAGIDFQIQLVPFAIVSGLVAGGEEASPVAVMLMPQDWGGRGLLGGPTLIGRTQADGSFSIANVPPGRYMAIARSGGRVEPKTGMQAIVVNGQNIAGVALMLQPGVSLSGNITVESSGTPAPADYSSFRVDAPDVTPLPFGGGPGGARGFVGGGGDADRERAGGAAAGSGRVEKNGAFKLDNLLPGPHYIRFTGGSAQGQSQWTLKSVTIAGQDVTDTPVELKPGQNVDNITVVLTDRASEISGTVRDARGAGAAALTVIAFSTDPQHWRAQSRRIQAVRTDQSGAFRLRSLPVGDYLVTVSADVEQGEWFDPAYLEQASAGAKRVSLSEGEKKTLDLRGPS